MCVLCIAIYVSTLYTDSRYAPTNQHHLDQVSESLWWRSTALDMLLPHLALLRLASTRLELHSIQLLVLLDQDHPEQETTEDCHSEHCSDDSVRFSVPVLLQRPDV